MIFQIGWFSQLLWIYLMFQYSTKKNFQTSWIMSQLKFHSMQMIGDQIESKYPILTNFGKNGSCRSVCYFDANAFIKC